MISALLGGVGLFLLGMTLMTEGLKAAAGGALRDVLRRFSGGTLRAFLSGAGLTALVQSSTATTVMTIGFVSAGLLTFAQAVGVIYGAAVGTTTTSWLVASLGLKYSASVLALPLIGIGALLRLLGRGRVASVGLLLAGFGLIFVGIDTLQHGMVALSDRVDFGAIAGETFRGRLVLLVTGVAMSVIMQSSSAAVATTLAAVHSGTVDLVQAASLVIGHTMGTTVTALLVSIGASIPARRTALAHVLLNTLSGVVAFVALAPFLTAVQWVGGQAGLTVSEEIALFHTAFNLLGVAILFPLTPAYARFITRILPDRSPPLTRFLDDSVQQVPAVAIEAARRSAVEIARSLIGLTRDVLRGEPLGERHRPVLEAARQALSETRAFVGGIRSSPEEAREFARHLGILHAVDHLERLIEAVREPPMGGWPVADAAVADVARTASRTGHDLGEAILWLDGGGEGPAPDIGALSRAIAERRRIHRPDVMQRTASGALSPDLGLGALDAMRWIDRLVYHVWRAVHHLDVGGEDRIPESPGTYEDAPAPAPG